MKYCVPQLDMIDLASIDIILISNFENMLSLPFITEYSRFKGQIYATEPTIQIGRQLMHELILFNESSIFPQSTQWQKNSILSALSPSFGEQLSGANQWKDLYKRNDVESCISKIISVSYDQNIDLNFYASLRICATSSGYCLGGANWILQTAFEKIVYFTDSSILQRHPQLLEINSLKNCDIILMTHLNNVEQQFPSTITELCNHINSTLTEGGNILIPCDSAGIIFDLIERVYQYLIEIGRVYVPIYFISPSAEYLLAYTNIIGEWLSQTKQEKLFIPEAPFLYEDLIKNGKLHHFKDENDPKFISTFREPCITFVGHSSLRFGSILYFLSRWGSDSKNCAIFTNPKFEFSSLLAPFPSLMMKLETCFLDPRISISEATNLIQQIKPKHIITNSMGLKVSETIQLTNMKHMDIISVPLEHRLEPAKISPELAKSLIPQDVGNKSVLANVAAVVHLLNNEIKLDIASTADVKVVNMFKQRSTWGKISLELIVDALKELEIEDFRIENELDGKTTIYFDTLKSSITLTPNETTISSRDISTKELLIKEIILPLLTKE